MEASKKADNFSKKWELITELNDHENSLRKKIQNFQHLEKWSFIGIWVSWSTIIFANSKLIHLGMTPLVGALVTSGLLWKWSDLKIDRAKFNLTRTRSYINDFNKISSNEIKKDVDVKSFIKEFDI